MSFAANPRAPKPDPSQIPQESTGPVAADSLAAESLDNDGSFAGGNAAASSVTGSASTFANTDTSGASVLPAASSGTEREEQTYKGAGADERGPSGLKLDAADEGGAAAPAGASDFGATTLGSNTGADPNITSGAAATGSTGTGSAGGGPAPGSGSGPTSGAGVRPHVPAAPTYAQTNLPSGTLKPKGEGLDDADVSNSIPQTKTFTGDVGGVHDPGRLAERGFQQPGEGGKGAASSGFGEQGGQYGALESERA